MCCSFARDRLIVKNEHAKKGKDALMNFPNLLRHIIMLISYPQCLHSERLGHLPGEKMSEDLYHLETESQLQKL